MFLNSINKRFYNFFFSILLILFAGFTVIFIHQIISFSIGNREDTKSSLLSSKQWKTIVLDGSLKPIKTDNKCNHYSCFSVYRCGRSIHQKLSVYTYPLMKFVDEDGTEIRPVSREFVEILEAVVHSEYATNDPENACIFVPPIDTLNENNLRKDKIAEALTSLPYWRSGENHLLFNMLPGTSPEFKTALGIERGKALLAGGGFSTQSFRRSFDISIPVYNPIFQDAPPSERPLNGRKYLLVLSQMNIHSVFREDMKSQAIMAGSNRFDFLVLEACHPYNLTTRCKGNEVFQYPNVLTDVKLCLIVRTGRLGQTSLYDAMRAGCIPVVMMYDYVLPFSDVIDWRNVAILIYEEQFLDVLSIVKTQYSTERLGEMQLQAIWIYKRYFATMKDITLTTLRILNDRMFPVGAKTLTDWNQKSSGNIQNPLFYPLTAPEEDGFTAVILTYDRVESLYQVIESISKVPSLSKILVIWNNQVKKPPPASSWPKLNVPIKVIPTKENKLSNRFYPYEEIETESILAIDDDINMMTIDELQFGYEVWREFPDRIVGFPSRNVVWNNSTSSWKYDSEWTNELSMVLTGVAFYHKYWSYVYSTQMPGNTKDWVDKHMNCEDIAMNFLIANKTGKAPIKVTPRKKFKCGECMSGDISSNEAHLVERSQCVNYFTKVFGIMPLKTVEFRADPTLFKEDKVPKSVKKFNNMGGL